MVNKMYLATLFVSIGWVMSSPVLNTTVDDDNDVIDISLKLNLEDLMKNKINAIDDTSSEITNPGPPVIPRNLTLGEPCGSCLCPPNYTLGDCEQGLRCEHDTLTADAPGLCVKLGSREDINDEKGSESGEATKGRSLDDIDNCSGPGKNCEKLDMKADVESKDPEPRDVNDVISEEETKIQLNLNINVDGVTQTKSILIPLNGANPKKDNKASGRSGYFHENDKAPNDKGFGFGDLCLEEGERCIGKFVKKCCGELHCDGWFLSRQCVCREGTGKCGQTFKTAVLSKPEEESESEVVKERLQGRKLTPKQDMIPTCKLKGQLCGKASYPEAPDNGECCSGSKLRCAYYGVGGSGTCTDKVIDCSCDCPRDCQKVCGTDGNPYCNKCYLKCHACKFGKSDLKVDIDGNCTNEPRISTSCKEPSICKTMDLIGIKLGASKGMCSVIPNLRSKCPVTCGMKKDCTDTQDKEIDSADLQDVQDVAAEDKKELKLNLNIDVDGVEKTKTINIPLA